MNRIRAPLTAFVLLALVAASFAAGPVLRHSSVFAVGGVSQFSGRRVPLESLDYTRVRHSWTPIRRLADHEPVHLTFALHHDRSAEIISRLYEVSSPQSPKYRQYLTFDQVAALSAPPSETVTAVSEWISAFGGSNCEWTAAQDFVHCTFACGSAREMLGTHFMRFETTMPATQSGKASTTLRAVRGVDGYTVPESIAPHLDFVGGASMRLPSTSFVSKSPMQQQQQQQQQQTRPGTNALAVTPHVLRKRYNVSSTVGSHPSNAQAVAQFLNQHYVPADLEEFFIEFGEGFTHLNHVTKVVGPNHLPAGTEASLDIEYIMALGANISTWFWSSPGEHEGQEPFLDWIIAVGNTSDVPLVHSVSYGDDEDSLSIEYMQRINVEFAKLGLRGISIMFASGDSGASCTSSGTFSPNFPTSSPFVTAVGGTMFNSVLGESGEDANYISGGGFSNVFPMPAYQTDAVEAFLDSAGSHLPPAKFFNVSGRAYPDVAALSDGFVVVVDLIPLPGVAGTSAATPTFSGIVALLNDMLLSRGDAPLGFLNPLLYTKGYAGFYDVTNGCHGGCSGQIGFCAQAGWDPVTGFGSPDYERLSKLI